MIKSFYKKIVLAGAFLMALPAFLFSQNDDDVMQVMVPRDVYIGDTGQIQYSFRTPEDFFVISDPQYISGDNLELKLTSEDLFEDGSCCSVLKSVLIRNGVNYNLCITIIPWTVGKISFKDFDLKKICSGGQQEGFTIRLLPLKIASLTEKLGVTDMKPVYSPIVLPGTNYVLWVLFIAGFLLLLLVAMVILRLNVLVKKIKAFYVALGFYRNARSTKIQLKKLLKQKTDDKTFCYLWQKIFRKYLSYRFASSFDSVPAARIEIKIFTLTGQLASSSQEEALEELSVLFTRTDYIRFADGSIDSKLLPLEKHQAVLGKDERKTIVEKSMKIIFEMEKNEQEETGV